MRLAASACLVASGLVLTGVGAALAVADEPADVSVEAGDVGGSGRGGVSAPSRHSDADRPVTDDDQGAEAVDPTATSGTRTTRSVSYTHLTLPTILRV